MCAPACARRIRTGFFPEDPDFIDPESVLFAQREGMRWRYMDDPTLAAPVLERSNVGMGMLVLNRQRGLDLPTVNELYTRLRNLEVNSLKRFVGFTAMDPGPFCIGLDPKELLLAAALAKRDERRLPPFSRALLWNHQELCHLMASYTKPLVCHISGKTSGSGAALACSSSFSGAYTESEVTLDFCRMGLTPSGGLSFKLAGLKWHMGEFLALTGWTVRGADLVYLDLVKHWMSPEALPFLELTSEKQLEVSERDALTLLEEHSLPVPDKNADTNDSVPLDYIPLVAEVFALSEVNKIVSALQEMSQGNAPGSLRKTFADKCLAGMKKASPLALHATLHLIQECRRMQRREMDVNEDSLRLEAMKMELSVLHKMLATADAVTGLHRRCLGEEVKPEEWAHTLTSPTKEEVQDLLTSDFEEFAVSPRSEISLSTHPRMRKYHPDYDPATGLDHDPAWMAQEVERWSPGFLADERERAIGAMLGGRDPAEYGQARYSRGLGGRL